MCLEAPQIVPLRSFASSVPVEVDHGGLRRVPAQPHRRGATESLEAYRKQVEHWHADHSFGAPVAPAAWAEQYTNSLKKWLKHSKKLGKCDP